MSGPPVDERVAANTIDLAACPHFQLGPLEVRPPTREVRDEGGGLHLIEPRVMQVLITLARAQGAVVSRDVMVARCWDRRVVGEDAINRAVSKARHVAELSKPPAFAVEAIPRVGYRLVVSQRASELPSREVTDRRPISPHEGGRWWIVSVAALGFGVVTLLYLQVGLARHRPLRDARVAVIHFEAPGADAAARAFADELHDKIADALANSQIVTMASDRLPAGAAGFGAPAALTGPNIVMKGAVLREGADLEVRARLEDTAEHVTLWSEYVRGPASAPAALQTSVATQVADAATWVKVALSAKSPLDAATLTTFIAGRENLTDVRNGGSKAAVVEYQEVVAAAPNFTWGHSATAAAIAFGLLDAGEGAEVARRRQFAVHEAQRALALDAHNGEAYLALGLLTPGGAWGAREALFARGATIDPGFEPVVMMEGRALWSVGRGREALRWLRDAHAVNPLHNGASWSLAVALTSEGFSEEGRALVKQMEAEWPTHRSTRDARFWSAVVASRWTEALELIGSSATGPEPSDEKALAAWRAALTARSAPSVVSKRVAVTRILEAVRSHSLSPGPAVLLLAMLGDVDDAFFEAGSYQPSDPYQPPYLFMPAAAPLRADPRFMELARRLGYLAYWRSSGYWPDFCEDQALRYDCRTAAAKAGK